MWELLHPRNRSAFKRTLLVLLLVPMTAMSMSPGQAWVSISGGEDVPASINDLVVDANGNTYVAGEAASAFVTQKFGPDGVRLWSVTGEAYSSAHALTLTSDGGVAVTGHSNGQYGYHTVKYSSGGELLWSRHFTADELQPQSATAIAATLDGGVVVTGRSRVGVNQDAHTIRYASDGQVLWEQRYQMASGYNDEASDVVVATDGSIVVVGRGSPVFPWGISKWFAVKYSDDGEMLWERSAPETSGASAVAATEDGGVVVTGYRRNGYYDYYTIKYASDGQIEWEQSYNSPNGDHDYASAVAVAGDGSVVVTGTAENLESGDSDYVTIKYSSDGQVEWDRSYSGPGKGTDSAHAIAVASNGDVVVTGTSENADQRNDYYTIRYSGDGQVQWEQRYDGPSNRNDAAYAVAVAPDGSLRVGGTQAGPVTDDFGLIRYEAGGGQTWVATEGTAPEGAVPWGKARFGRELLIDSSGNTFVAGSASEGFLTQKIGPDGNVIWSISYNGAPDSGIFPCFGPNKDRSLAATGDGGVVVTGWLLKYIDEPGYCDTEYYTVKYSGEGDILWERHGDNQEGIPVAVVVTGDDDIIVTGNSVEAHTIKYSSNGDVVWELDDPGHSERIAMVGTVDGGVVVTGIWRRDSDYDFCTVKYSGDGQLIWERHFDGDAGSSDDDQPYAMTATSDGGVVVVGYSTIPASGFHADFYTIKYSSDGQVTWEQRLDGPDHENDRAHAVAESADGGVVVTGYSLNASGDADFLTVKYSADGQLQWQRRFDGLGGGWANSEDVAYALTATSDGGAVVTGYSRTEEDEGDYYTIKYSGDGEVEWEHRPDGLGQSMDRAFAVAVAPDGSLRIGGNMGDYIGVVKLEESSVFTNGFEDGLQSLEPAHR